jgi:cytochrome c-type protein NapC
MRHVYEYLLGGYREMSSTEALEAIHIRKPYPNSNCMQCHSTTGQAWLDQEDHAQMLDEIRGGAVSCASEGCHGPAHPFSKPAEEP